MSGFNIKAMLKEFQNYVPEKLDDQFSEANSDIVQLLIKSLEMLRNPLTFEMEAISNLQAVLDYTWERLNIGHWKNIPLVQRKVYSLASLLKSVAVLRSCENTTGEADLKDNFRKALEVVDRGLLLGSSYRKELAHIARVLSSALDIGSASESNKSNPNVTLSVGDELKIPCENISVLKRPSLQYFFDHHFKPCIPVKIVDCMSHWPALNKWCDLSYFRHIAGSRTVPVELGSNYLNSDWSQSLMTLGSFIDCFVDCNSSCKTDSESSKPPIAYLAQHQLFDQIPELKEDIFEPEYCCLSENPDLKPEETDINAWFGPCGTVSPLHYDPKHNILSQVVGSKSIVLFSPKDSEKLYPHEGTMLSNSAQVDLENPDFVKYPDFQKARGFKCQLNPGEMLYIPPKWWHHVRSLSTSFSVSFWWN